MEGGVKPLASPERPEMGQYKAAKGKCLQNWRKKKPLESLDSSGFRLGKKIEAHLSA